mmetsp:Transcript_30779/g.28002  ORF Transcript_30779/g.28002 Transcript_30779/m.28002 type:complete len:211 (-) Transcript_30779:127-759(-)
MFTNFELMLWISSFLLDPSWSSSSNNNSVFLEYCLSFFKSKKCKRAVNTNFDIFSSFCESRPKSFLNPSFLPNSILLSKFSEINMISFIRKMLDSILSTFSIIPIKSYITFGESLTSFLYLGSFKICSAISKTFTMMVFILSADTSSFCLPSLTYYERKLRILVRTSEHWPNICSTMLLSPFLSTTVERYLRISSINNSKFLRVCGLSLR